MKYDANKRYATSIIKILSWMLGILQFPESKVKIDDLLFFILRKTFTPFAEYHRKTVVYLKIIGGVTYV